MPSGLLQGCCVRILVGQLPEEHIVQWPQRVGPEPASSAHDSQLSGRPAAGVWLPQEDERHCRAGRIWSGGAVHADAAAGSSGPHGVAAAPRPRGTHACALSAQPACRPRDAVLGCELGVLMAMSSTGCNTPGEGHRGCSHHMLHICCALCSSAHWLTSRHIIKVCL